MDIVVEFSVSELLGFLLTESKFRHRLISLVNQEDWHEVHLCGAAVAWCFFYLFVRSLITYGTDKKIYNYHWFAKQTDFHLI